MQMVPYLSFNGQCEEAFKFYEKVLGGKILAMMRFAGSPMAEQMPAAFQQKIMHARIALDGQTLMGSDAPPERYQGVKGSQISSNSHFEDLVIFWGFFGGDGCCGSVMVGWEGAWRRRE